MILTTQPVRDKNGKLCVKIVEFQTLEEYEKFETEKEILRLKSKLQEAEEKLKKINRIVDKQNASFVEVAGRGAE